MRRPGMWALEFVLGREEGGVGSAITERHAEALRGTDGDIGTKIRPALEQGQGEQIGGHGDLATERSGRGR